MQDGSEAWSGKKSVSLFKTEMPGEDLLVPSAAARVKSPDEVESAPAWQSSCPAESLIVLHRLYSRDWNLDNITPAKNLLVISV